MKKLIIVLSAFVLVSLPGFCQKITPEKVQASVKQAFVKMFPSASDVKYEMEKKDYEINFIDKGNSRSILCRQKKYDKRHLN